MALARALLALPLLTSLTFAQGPPANGPASNDPAWHALVGGTVIVRPGQRLDHATLVLRAGRVTSVTANGPVPAGARVFDCTGLTLYPGLVEPFLPVDAPAPDPDAPRVHWHPMVLAQRSALDGDGASSNDREQLRALGFTAAAIAPTGGVFKGSAAVVLLGEAEPGERAPVVRAAGYQLCSMQTRSGGHPSSAMGAIALLRQTLFDADWYERCNMAIARDATLRAGAPTGNAALQALIDQRGLPLAFDVDDELEVLRAAKVAAETGRSAFAIGSGMEFRRVQAIAKAGLPIVVPVNFPEPPAVATLAEQERVSLRQLQSWEQAPTNLQRLLAAGVRVALTTARLAEKKEFRAQLAEAIACGVTTDQALAALTTTPAELLGVTADLGTLEPGHLANIVAVAGDLFDPKARIDAVWIGGRRYDGTAAEVHDFDGRWTATVARATAVTIQLTIGDGGVRTTIGEQGGKAANVVLTADRLELVIERTFGDGPNWCRLRRVGDTLQGELRCADGTFAVQAVRTTEAAKEAPAPTATTDPIEPDATARPSLAPLPVPLGGYGMLEPPTARTAVFTGATVWTCGDDGVVPLGALMIRDGKIVYAGARENMPTAPADALIVDCTGKHITPGLIDCHSHTGISRGVNEGGEAVTAEVRVQDVVNPDDVNWYRQLAGGVTTVNQLHGSANAIGGQSNTVKLRWGATAPDDLLFAGAVPGIKFALGENPRRANGGERSDRYPNTRMGVEALIRDRFLAAADYRRRLQQYEALAPRARAATLPPRRDLELEALAEVLAGQRRVHCHSYRQDEIFMLCSMAKEFGFRIGTFQHVLEGYKVAEAIRANAVGASAFSDWWAYKFEVYDAIPENGAILHAAGVCVSFNSDSDEHARRLNTEAGKAVRYGGVPPAEALCFVTANPAIQLGIDQRTGRLARGLDADFAIWSDDPLSYASVCESTWVDGAERFSRQRDRELRGEIARERARLLRKALAAGSKKGRTAKDDERDAYWAAEDRSATYTCRDCEGAGR